MPIYSKLEASSEPLVVKYRDSSPSRGWKVNNSYYMITLHDEFAATAKHEWAAIFIELFHLRAFDPTDIVTQCNGRIEGDENIVFDGSAPVYECTVAEFCARFANPNIIRKLQLDCAAALIGPITCKNMSGLSNAGAIATDDLILDSFIVTHDSGQCDHYLMLRYVDLSSAYASGLAVDTNILIFSDTAILQANGVALDAPREGLYNSSHPSIVPIFADMCKLARPTFLRRNKKVSIQFIKKGVSYGTFTDINCCDFQSHVNEHVLPLLRLRNKPSLQKMLGDEINTMSLRVLKFLDEAEKGQ